MGQGGAALDNNSEIGKREAFAWSSPEFRSGRVELKMSNWQLQMGVWRSEERLVLDK